MPNKIAFDLYYFTAPPDKNDIIWNQVGQANASAKINIKTVKKF